MQIYKQLDPYQNMVIQEEFKQLKCNIMYKAIRQLEFDPDKFKGEVIDEISETIPGQAYSVNEVLLKFTQGTLGDIGIPTYYDFEDEIDVTDDIYNSFDPTLSPDFDLADAEEYLRHHEAKNSLKSEINEAKPGEDEKQISPKSDDQKQENE